MKKLTALLLCAALTLSMAACASPAQPPSTTAPPETDASTAPSTQPPVTDPPVTEPPVTEPPVTEPPATEPPEPHEKFDTETCSRLVGTWRTTVTLDTKIMNFEYFTGKTTFDLYYTFTEDGFFRAYADQEEFDNAIDTYEALVVDHMVELRYTTFKGQLEWQGISSTEIIDEMWSNGPEVEARTDCEEFIVTMNLYHRFAALLREGQYYVEAGKLYTQLADGSFESSAYVPGTDTLTLVDTSNPGAYRPLCINFPLYFEACE